MVGRRNRVRKSRRSLRAEADLNQVRESETYKTFLAVAVAYGGPETLRKLLRSNDVLQVRVSTLRKRIYADAAATEGLSLSAWVLVQLDAAVGQSVKGA